MPCIDTGRVSLFFEDAGSGGVPVLLLHELGGSSESWREDYKVHLDSYNLVPALKGEATWPRKEFIYWTDDGSVAALRYNGIWARCCGAILARTHFCPGPLPRKTLSGGLVLVLPLPDHPLHPLESREDRGMAAQL